MGIPTNTRQAYTEVDVFLNLLDKEEREKVPEKLRKLFETEKDFNYKKIISIDEPISNQNLKEETLGIIAFLYLRYWCTDDQEIQRLNNIYEKNEQLYQEKVREKFNPDNIFNNNIEEKTVEEQYLIEYKEEPIFKKIINKIKRLLKK